ncbi:MAG: phosphate ABC transporter permease PstA [Gemmatimonadetes bacterium]|nr:phosphate ABC transporter permease PstA [Gemmatimonadota bacterium]
MAGGARRRDREQGAVTVRALRRRAVSALMTGLVAGLCLLAVLPLLFILGDLVAKGASSIDWHFFTRSPAPAGESGGGVANAIAGTGVIVGLAGLIGLPVGIGAGIFLAEYGAGRLGFFVRFVADVMNGTPSIVVGIFAWTFIVKPVGHFSALAGAVALAVLMVPMIARTSEEMVRLVPHSLREAALALGYPRWRTSLRVVVRSALSGIVTGSLVAIARVAGETAPLLFTALGNLNFTTDVSQPMQTLSLQIYVYATGPFDEWHRLAWAAALVLMGLVLVLALFARWVTRERYGAR